ncbi:hypothetical protein CHKEEEPN_0266 [Methylorubrum podarium]|nr:hypothetical protein CHKEEEPN_0266 [Methylorubrum podarium]
MHLDDGLQRLGVGEPDVVEEAAAQEGVRQLLLVVRGDDDDRAVFRADRLAGLVDVELHPVEFGQQVVGELDVGLVDLVDEQHRPGRGGERLPQLAAADVVRNVRDPRVAELRVAQPRDRVVLVEALLRLRGRFDVPGQQRRVQAPGDLLGQHRLAGAGLALHQKRALQHDRGVDRRGEIGRRDVGLGSGEAHGASRRGGVWAGLTRREVSRQQVGEAASVLSAYSVFPSCHTQLVARIPRFTSDFCGCGRVLPSIARSILISTWPFDSFERREK